MKIEEKQDTLEILNYVVRNTQMGCNTLNQLCEDAKTSALKKELETQKEHYSEVLNKATVMLHNMGEDAEKLGPMTKVSTYVGVAANTMRDSSPRHMADMLIQGSTMGVVDITKRLKDYPNVTPEAHALADSLMHFEQDNIEHLKAFL
ncbi:MAG: hypothetical protein PHG02_10365 [Oscillospiraceae bacterium]|nr:hypothetical protein [Oscillospiraceae bacterium]